MGLEAEAVLRGKTLKKLASEFILKSISQRALQFVHERYQSPHLEGPEEKGVSAETRRSRISGNAEAIEQIKVLWSQNPRPSQREIAKIIDYPASSTKYQIKSMLKKGELSK